MVLPAVAFQVLAASVVVSVAFEVAIWLLFHRGSSYGSSLKQLERMGQRLDAAQQELAADPVSYLWAARGRGRWPPAAVSGSGAHMRCAAMAQARPGGGRGRHPAPAHPLGWSPPNQTNNSKKKAMQRLERELRKFSMDMQGTKMKIQLLTMASMVGGMYLINRHFKGIVVAKVQPPHVQPGAPRPAARRGRATSAPSARPGARAPLRRARAPPTDAAPPPSSRAPLSPSPRFVARQMPFVPPNLFSGITHMGLPGSDLTEVGASFFYMTTGPLLRANLQKLLGTGPSRTALKYLNSPVAMDKKTA
jgi:hypothetical protein